jgi:hypothetical protein
VLSMIRERRQPTREDIAMALGAAALFACCSRYREIIAQRVQKTLSPDLLVGSRLARSRVRGELQQLLSSGGIGWGRPDEPDSWACTWEIECFVVSQLATKDFGPLSWPFGPSLVRFYSLERELDQLLTRVPEMRRWYGPCATAEALLWAEQPQRALQVLSQERRRTKQEAKEWPGYARLQDPCNALLQDVNSAESDAWFYLLNRNQFTAETAADKQEEVRESMVTCCRALLTLLDQGLELSNRLTLTLRAVFTRMVQQIRTPAVYLGRKATVADAEARKICMDRIVELLTESMSGPKTSQWLPACVGALKARRSELTVELVNLKCVEWNTRSPGDDELDEIDRLSEQAVADDAADPGPNVLRAEVQMVIALSRRGDEGLAAFEQPLKNLMNLALAHRWHSDSIKTISELIQYSRNSDQFTGWMRSRMLDGGQRGEKLPHNSSAEEAAKL